jgi:autotransporter-associated beta strand protein
MSRIAVILVLFAIAISSVPHLQAQTYWKLSPSQAGDWSNPSNWSGGEPGSNTSTFVDNGGTVTVTQSGAVCASLSIGSSGTLQMTGGDLTMEAGSLTVGDLGAGTFMQSGGTTKVNWWGLYLGYNAGCSGTYILTGTGQLSSPEEWIGSTASAIALFQQSGGTNTTEYLSIGPTARYVLNGGTLQITGSTSTAGGFSNQGQFDFAGGAATVTCANAIVDFTQGGGAPLNTQSATLSVAANTLLMVPANYDPSTAFAHFSNQGVLYVQGTTLTIPSGQNIVGAGWFSISDHVNCQGTLAVSQMNNGGTVTSGVINLNNGLTFSGTGTVNLGGGTLRVNDSISGMTGGTLSAAEYVGYSGTGSFAQTGGSNSGVLYLGYNAGDNGTYGMSGSAGVSMPRQYIGYSGIGVFTHYGTGDNSSNNSGNGGIFLGYNAGSSGTYILGTAGGLYFDNLYVGYSGAGTLTQSSGNVTNNYTGGWLAVGMNSGSTGTYNLGGSGILRPIDIGEVVGNSGTGVFNQSGGTNSFHYDYLFLGYSAGGSGTYNLGGTGYLTTGYQYVGYSGSGTFAQSGGTNTTGELHIGDHAGAGSYILSGAGCLSATQVFVGSTATTGALFQQTGGTNTPLNLTVASGARFELSGGTLQIDNGGFVSLGVFDGSNGNAVFNASNSIIDISNGTRQNLNSISLNLAANSLLIVPAGFDTSTAFHEFTCSGLVHTAGTTLTVANGQGFGGIGSVNDLVVCQGTITSGTLFNGNTQYALNLNNGLVLSEPGSVILNSVTVNDQVSGMSGGSLAGGGQYVGSGGTGLFAQSGGTNSIGGLTVGNSSSDSGTYCLQGTSYMTCYAETIGYYGAGTFTQSGGTNTLGYGYLYLGVKIGGSGTYLLNGAGRLSSDYEYVGYSGTGAFTQSAGTNSVNYCIYFGDDPTGNRGVGTYYLSETGILTAGSEIIGYEGSGTFTQAGGTNSVSNLIFGYYSGCSATYNLTGGTLVVGSLSKDPGTVAFNFGGGTLRATRAFSTNMPMTLTSVGGDATVDTGGYAVTLSGQLSGPGGLDKMGSGTLTLSAANSYTGLTTVTSGTISLTGSLNGNSALAIGAATLNYVPTAHGGTGSSQTLAGLTVNTGLATVNVSAGNTLSFGPIVANTGSVVGFNTNSTGTLLSTQTNSNGILGAWATYGSGTSMMYAAGGGSNSPYTIVPYAGATVVTTGVDGLSDTTGTVNYAISSGGGTLTTGVSANTLQFTGTANMIAISGGNSISLNGIMNVGSSASAIAGGNLVIGGTRQLVFAGPGSTTVGAVIQDNASGSSAVVMAGSGALVLNTANGYNGGTYLLNGTLCVNDPAALGSGPLTICGGGLDNSGAGAVIVSTNNPQAWNGSFAFVGTRALDLGTGPVSLGNNVTVTVNASGLTVGGAISGPYSLTKAGAGTLTLGGGNAYSGGTVLLAGRLNVDNPQALGGGMFTVGGTSTIDNSTAGPLTLSTDNPQAWNADFTFAGTQDLNLGNGVITLGGNRTVTVKAKTLTVGGPIGGTCTLTKAGGGTLSLSGASDNTGLLANVTAGTLLLAKASSANVHAVGGSLSINGGTVRLGGSGGDQIPDTVNVCVASGAFDNNGLTETIGSLYVGCGGATGTSGYTSLSSGALSSTATNWYGIVVGSTGTGVVNQTGGTFNVATGIAVGESGNGFGVFNLSGGTTTINTNNTAWTFNLGPNPGIGVLTVKGSGQLNAPATNITMGAYTSASTSIINLGGVGSGGGIINTASIFNQWATGIVNFHGGTLQANTDTGVDNGWYNGGHNTGFLVSTTNYVYGEGAVIDTNGHNITISTALQTPTGKGLTSVAVSAGGSGYIGAPAVQISGGGGTGATAYATVDSSSGAVTGIVITNPGVGYTGTPTVTLVGGGGSGATINTRAITTAPNSSGGLTKLGTGTLTLSGASTYTGNTIVSAGTLEVANTIGSATGSGAVTVNSGAALTGSGIIGGPVTVAGTLTPGSSPGILTVNNQVTFQPGSTFDAEVFGLTAGTGYDELTTTGPVSLAGSLALTFGSFTPTGDDILFLINNTGSGATTGTFQYADHAEIGTFNGFNWYITYEANNAATPSLSGGNDVAIYSESVPEPSTLALLVTGLLGSWAVIRSQRNGI